MLRICSTLQNTLKKISNVIVFIVDSIWYDFVVLCYVLFGTPAGEVFANYPFCAQSLSRYPMFCKKDTLDIQQIKGYFGTKLPQLKVALIKMIEKENAKETTAEAETNELDMHEYNDHY